MSLVRLENTAAGWLAANTVIAAGTIGRETDTFKIKIGDGSTAWSSLAYVLADQSLDELVGASVIGAAVLAKSNLASSAAGVRGTGMVPAASGVTFHGGASTETNYTGDGGRMCRGAHNALFEFGSVRLGYGNFQLANAIPEEVAGANNILVRASVEDTGGQTAVFRYVSASTAWSSVTAYALNDAVTSGGITYVATTGTGNTNKTPATNVPFWRPITYYPVHFFGENATRDVTIAPGMIVFSEPVQLTPAFAKGAVFYDNTLVQPNNGTANTGNYPGGAATGTLSNVTGGGNWMKASAAAAAPPDYTLSAPTTDTSAAIATATPLYGPCAIVALPKKSTGTLPVIFLNGDSYFVNTADSSTLLGNEYGSWATRLLCDNPTTPTQFLYPFALAAKGATKAASDTGPGFMLRLMIAAGCTHFVDQKAINDIAAGASLASLQALALNRWTTLLDLGVKVVVGTCPVETTSTDSFATTANQTPKTGFTAGGVQQQYNAWLKTFPHAAISAVIDVAGTVNVTDAGTGFVVWNPALSNLDGIHPNTAGHTAIATSAQVFYATAPTVPVTISAAGLFGQLPS